MRIVLLILSEIWHRKLNFLLGLLAVTAAVSIYVFLMTISKASYREVKQLMRDLGFNLLILPRETQMERFWATDFSEAMMPEEYVYRLAESKEVTADHYIAILQQKISWRNKQILLIGWLPELPSVGRKRKKRPMGYKIPLGKAYVGYEIARSLNIQPNEQIDIFGTSLVVDAVLAKMGSKEDISIYAHLHDVQKILKKEGKINMIKALRCLCPIGGVVGDIEEIITRVLPGVKVVELKTIATIRAKTRRMIKKYGLLIFSVILPFCIIFVSSLALANVWDRRREIGIFKAIGLNSLKVSIIFLGRAVILGLLGGFLGFLIGTYFSLQFGPDICKITAAAIKPIYSLFIISIIGAPSITILASLLPTIIAATMDPANILLER